MNGVLNTDDILNSKVSATDVDVYTAVDLATSKRKYVMSFYTENVDVAVLINSWGMMQVEFVVDENMIARGKCTATYLCKGCEG